MTKRTMAAYVALFNYIEENICKLAPVSFMSDYETPLRNAIRMVYPNSSLRGCYFHLTQALRKKASKIRGLFSSINESTDSTGKYRCYHKFMALPLLPKDKLHEGFALLKAESSAFGNAFNEFVEYFDRQWLTKVCCYYITLYL